MEVDASNYAIPAPHLCEAWAAAVPPGFTFNVKAFCLFTAKQVVRVCSGVCGGVCVCVFC